jgi:hypothetical protein
MTVQTGDPAAMTAQEFTAAVAALCKPGEAALILIDDAEGPSWCVASGETAHQTARTLAAEPDETLLGVAVVSADGALTEYYAAPADFCQTTL